MHHTAATSASAGRAELAYIYTELAAPLCAISNHHTINGGSSILRSERLLMIRMTTCRQQQEESSSEAKVNCGARHTDQERHSWLVRQATQFTFASESGWSIATEVPLRLEKWLQVTKHFSSPHHHNIPCLGVGQRTTKDSHHSGPHACFLFL